MKNDDIDKMSNEELRAALVIGLRRISMPDEQAETMRNEASIRLGGEFVKEQMKAVFDEFGPLPAVIITAILAYRNEICTNREVMRTAARARRRNLRLYEIMPARSFFKRLNKIQWPSRQGIH